MTTTTIWRVDNANLIATWTNIQKLFDVAKCRHHLSPISVLQAPETVCHPTATHGMTEVLNGPVSSDTWTQTHRHSDAKYFISSRDLPGLCEIVPFRQDPKIGMTRPPMQLPSNSLHSCQLLATGYLVLSSSSPTPTIYFLHQGTVYQRTAHA